MWYYDRKSVDGFIWLQCCGTQQQETTQESLEPVTFTFYSADGLEDTWTDPVAQMITEKTGVTLKMDYPADSNDNRIELMVATGEYPDFVFAKGSVSTLIRNDALIDMSDLIDEYGPNIKKLYGDEYENLRYSSEDPFISCAVTKCRKKP